MKKRIREVLIVLAITVILLESLLQWINRAGKESHNIFLHGAYKSIQEPITWERYFLQTHQNGELVYFGVYQPDSLLGWSLKPSTQVVLDGLTFTSNRQGYRSLTDFNNDPEKYQVMIVGDSFTFGDEISDDVTWPYRLGKYNNKLNVLNMGGSGYGIDQMLLTLEKEIDHYHPDLIIAAFISDDLYRSMLGFRDFKKPQFQLQNNKLQLTNVPIGNLDDVVKEAMATSYQSSIQLLNLWRRLTHTYRRVEQGHCDADCLTLNTALFERMSALASSHQAEFLMIYLPAYLETSRADVHSYGQSFFEDYQKSHTNYFLNPRSAMVAAPFKKVEGHYQSNETNFLSQIVYEKIQTLPSWQHKPGVKPQ